MIHDSTTMMWVIDNFIKLLIWHHLWMRWFWFFFILYRGFFTWF